MKLFSLTSFHFFIDNNGFSIKRRVVVGLDNNDEDDAIQLAEVKSIFAPKNDPENLFIVCELLKTIKYVPRYVSYEVKYTKQLQIASLHNIADQVSYVAHDQLGGLFVDWA